MRALCGSIIAAGALIGLGLTALGIGTRYQGFSGINDKGEVTGTLTYHTLDRPLMLILVVLIICAVAGMVVAFIGLAYHHHRRHHEWLKEHGHLAEPHRTL